MPFVLALIGLLIAGLLGRDAVVLLGGGLGLALGLLWQQRKLIRSLAERLDAVDGGLPAAEQHPEFTPPERTEFPADSAPPVAAAAAAAATTEEGGWVSTDAPTAQPAGSESGTTEARTSAWLLNLWRLLVRFATTGNPVVRLGAVLLFIGVAYLLRYAYEHALVPIEMRLTGAALMGIGLLVLGWRLRARTDSYGLVLQGAGLAILYLTVFASARLYELLPMAAAFGILVVLVAGASVLAVLQNSQILATFAMSGGFLAPVLTSTGEGSHVALFSYYALLNAGILVMAWFRHWRWLNWIGFVFTFVIGTSWGFQYYQPEYYATTQPFLILFFVYYVTVSILFARRHGLHLQGVVDGTLVFGTPVLAFALQAALVRDLPFGLAYSALAAALVYTVLALGLRRAAAVAPLLERAFLALAVVFATLAIPFAFDNQRFTAATWALEGAGIYWVGAQQRSGLTRAFGVALQFAAGVAFVLAAGGTVAQTPFLNSAWLGAAFLGVAGLFTARQTDAYLARSSVASDGTGPESRWTRLESLSGRVLLGWGTLWWLAGGMRELAWFTPGEASSDVSNLGEHLFLIYTAVSMIVLVLVAKRLRWRSGLAPAFLLMPLGVAVLFGLDVPWTRSTALSDYGWIAWPLLIAGIYFHLWRLETQSILVSVWHAAGWWFVTLWLTWNASAWVEGLLPGSIWSGVLWGAVPWLVCALLSGLRDLPVWPLKAVPHAYSGWGWWVAYGYLLLWLLWSATLPGDPAPLPYVVLVNPLEIVQLTVLLLGAHALRQPLSASARQLLTTTVAGAAFLWLNSVAARAVHHYGDVPYPLERLLASDILQATLSILWSVIALVTMGVATRRQIRSWWIAGAMLLAVVILKLFFVDMAKLDLVGRMVSFTTVGILMLIIGYFAPVPPRAAGTGDQAAVRS